MRDICFVSTVQSSLPLGFQFLHERLYPVKTLSNGDEDNDNDQQSSSNEEKTETYTLPADSAVEKAIQKADETARNTFIKSENTLFKEAKCIYQRCFLPANHYQSSQLAWTSLHKLDKFAKDLSISSLISIYATQELRT
uniref:Uncharacterized protein n=1 Tax=Syphacia muris TaxID=451379 RepID=A0A0N5ABK2_9BILA